MTCKFYSEIQEGVRRVKDGIEAAAAEANRHPDEITLVGVTKTQPVEAVRALLNAGVYEIGENRVQELLQKSPFITDIPHKTHLIGNLQRNKAKYLPGKIDMLQSVDRAETVIALEKAYVGGKEVLDVLIEVNIGDETSKNGITLGEVYPLAEQVMASKALCLRGFMTIPPICKGDLVRRYFQIYRLFIDIREKTRDNNTITILSMGMSSDYKEAILEGATMVRVGTALFGNRV